MQLKYKKPELLAPAGNLEKLKVAFRYGADAVYFGGKDFSLRAVSQNFTFEEIKEGAEFAHSLGKKLYCTINVMPRNEGIDKLPPFLKQLEEAKVDAVLVSDIGVIGMVKKHSKLPIHISTQANTMNYEACNVWESLGAERVVLGRECSLEEIETIREKISEDLELEVFVHGSMCIAYSGRCLLSSYMTGRQSNLGACAQSCRWKYALVEEKRPNEYFPIAEDQNGTYIMNSKDLCMIDYLPELLNAGISSLKIEGRNKSEYYVALVVNAYRQAIDLYYKDPQNYKLPVDLKNELDKVNHRKYDTGFFFREPKAEGIIYKYNFHIRDYDMVARVLSYDEESGIATCVQRNKFVKGDNLEILAPGMYNQSFIVTELYNEDGEEIDMCQHPNMIFKVKVPFKLEKDDFFRAKVK